MTVGASTGFTLPAGKSVTIKFRATVDNVPGLTQISTQGTVSSTTASFPNVLTDDPAFAGTADPTVTDIDHTTVAVSSNANPSVFGQNVTFTATLAGVPVRANTLGGTVQFKADGNDIGAPAAITGAANSGTATVSISTLSVGSHVITAEYSGDANFNASIGMLSGGQVVNKADTSVGTISSQNPLLSGQSVTFTTTVNVTAPGAGTPTGTIDFLDGGNPSVLTRRQIRFSLADSVRFQIGRRANSLPRLSPLPLLTDASRMRTDADCGKWSSGSKAAV